MKPLLTALTIAAALTLTACTTTPAQPSYQNQPDVSGPTMAPTITPVIIDVTTTKSHTFDDGLKVTYDGVSVATAEQVTDTVEGMVPVILSFTYDNEGDAAIPLLQVPLDVTYGADGYAADQPTLFESDPTHSEIPQQISAGSTVPVVNTYWVPAGEPMTVTVQGTADPEVLLPVLTFTGITTP